MRLLCKRPPALGRVPGCAPLCCRRGKHRGWQLEGGGRSLFFLQKVKNQSLTFKGVYEFLA